jgi:osmotically-inducible protein OsmY
MPNWRDAGRGGREQGGSYAHRGRDYYGQERRAASAQQNVSPGGEYIEDRSRDYASDAYTDQGYGENRGRSDWRTEDRLPQHSGRGPRGYRRSDDRIREDVCELLTEDPDIDASDMEVSVSDSEITLSGTVRSRDEKRLAQDLAERVSGVRDVHNHLRLA